MARIIIEILRDHYDLITREIRKYTNLKQCSSLETSSRSKLIRKYPIWYSKNLNITNGIRTDTDQIQNLSQGKEDLEFEYLKICVSRNYWPIMNQEKNLINEEIDLQNGQTSLSLVLIQWEKYKKPNTYIINNNKTGIISQIFQKKCVLTKLKSNEISQYNHCLWQTAKQKEIFGGYTKKIKIKIQISHCLWLICKENGWRLI